jgi:ATP/maltotriose-dependent transcriptional regulator MalT
MIVAPAGNSKTTAAMEAVAERPLVAWHVCRRGHGDPFVLLTGPATAVERAHPRRHAPQPPPQVSVATSPEPLGISPWVAPS